MRKQVTTRTIRRDGQVYTETIEVVEEIPGDVRAQEFWLCNRNPQRWRRLSARRQKAGLSEASGNMLVVPQSGDSDVWLWRTQPEDL
jgi:hypothetical protein